MGNNDRRPKIRFKGFNDDWEQHKLGEICNSFEYGLNAASKEYDGKNKYIRITDINDETREFSKENLTSPDIDLKNLDSYKLKKGDIVFARTGASVGKTYLYNEKDEVVYYAGFLIRAQIKNQYSNEFIFQNTLTKKYIDFIYIMSQRSGQPGINSKEYASFELKVPNSEEQNKIGSFLNNIDNLISLHQRKLEKLGNIKKSMLEKMFPKDENKVPEIRFKGFNDDWEQRYIEDIASFSKGNGYSKSDLSNNGNPIILYGRLYTNYEFCIDKVNTYSKIKKGSVLSQGNEVIVPSSGETSEDIARASAIIKKGILIGGDLNIIRPIEIVESCFLALAISNGKTQKDLSSKAQGKSVVHIHNSDIKKIQVSFPKVKEQEKIIKLFKFIDNLISLHQRKLEKLKNIKKACLEKMFV